MRWARTSGSQITTIFAGKSYEPNIAQMSGPIPAGSPEVTKIVGERVSKVLGLSRRTRCARVKLECRRRPHPLGDVAKELPLLRPYWNGFARHISLPSVLQTCHMSGYPSLQQYANHT